jgi:hypothetical protein
MRVADAYDWSRFDVHMLLPAHVDAVYDCWATAAGMERFFARRFEFITPEGAPREPTDRSHVGDSYRLTFHHPSELEGRVLECRPGRLFAFSFGQMRVDVAFEPDGDRTLVRLVQSDIPTDDVGRAQSHLNCRSCWIYYLMNLRSVLEHDRDLRDSQLPDNPVGIDFGRLLEEDRS